MKRILLFTILAFQSILSFGQSTPTGKFTHFREQIWLGYFNQTRLTNKWGLWLDVHYRQTDNFIERPFQLLLRPAVTFYIKDNLRAHAGYAFVNHFPSEGLKTSRPEHRAWQQIWWNQKYTGLSTLQWLRLEERFNGRVLNDVLAKGFNRSYRLRYNFTFFIPLKGKEMVAGTPFAIVANELFLNLGSQVVYNTFDQNRFFAGVGYQFTAHLNAQLGYLNIYQQEAAGNSYIVMNGIRLFVFHTLDLRSTEDN